MEDNELAITNTYLLHLGEQNHGSSLEYLLYLLNGIGTSGDSRSSDPEVDVVKECACWGW